jgi:hypothetical protein
MTEPHHTCRTRHNPLHEAEPTAGMGDVVGHTVRRWQRFGLGKTKEGFDTPAIGVLKNNDLAASRSGVGFHLRAEVVGERLEILAGCNLNRHPDVCGLAAHCLVDDRHFAQSPHEERVAIGMRVRHPEVFEKRLHLLQIGRREDWVGNVPDLDERLSHFGAPEAF